MLVGFSTGAFHKYLRAKEALKLIKDAGCRAVELGFVNVDRFWSDQIDELDQSDFDGFDYVSFHAPKYTYGENREETARIFHRIERIHRLRSLDMVVFHPDTIHDFALFTRLDFPVGMENMDRRKAKFQSVEDIAELLAHYPIFGLVLDINHIFTNDPTMALAQNFYGRLGDKIVQIQASGFDQLHDPLFKTKQPEILRAIQNLNVPIIDEGLFDPKDIGRELAYIRAVLSEKDPFDN